jgi:hypothetical protein
MLFAASPLPRRADCSMTAPLISRDTSMVAFAICFFVFHHVPSIAGVSAADWIDLATPFAVVAASSLVLASIGAAMPAVALAVLGAVLYVDGHGIHLAANSIGHESLTGDAADVTHFWDEVFGHIEWHLGWVTLIASVALAEALSPQSRARRSSSRSRLLLAALVLGFTLFTSTVEGGTWWLACAGAGVFVFWALMRPRPLLVTCAGAFALAAALISVWAIWHGGIPQFSDVGWL